jgi:sec-independent protein translocase protein TatB
MFDLDAGKILVVGVVALLVIGPKDLPRVLRTVGNTVGKMRRMAAEFQNQFAEAIKEADLEDVKKEFTAIRDSAVIDTSFDAASIMREEITSAVDGKPAVEAKAIGHSVIDLTATATSEPATAASAEAAPQELISLGAEALEAPKDIAIATADLTGTGPIAESGHALPPSAPQELLSLAPSEAPEAPNGAAQSAAADLSGTGPIAEASHSLPETRPQELLSLTQETLAAEEASEPARQGEPARQSEPG